MFSHQSLRFACKDIKLWCSLFLVTWPLSLLFSLTGILFTTLSILLHAIFSSAFILLVLAYFLFKISFTSRAYHGPNRKMFFIFLLWVRYHSCVLPWLPVFSTLLILRILSCNYLLPYLTYYKICSMGAGTVPYFRCLPSAYLAHCLTIHWYSVSTCWMKKECMYKRYQVSDCCVTNSFENPDGI